MKLIEKIHIKTDDLTHEYSPSKALNLITDVANQLEAWRETEERIGKVIDLEHETRKAAANRATNYKALIDKLAYATWYLTPNPRR